MAEQIKNQVTVPANGVIQNIISGSQFEYSRTDQDIEIALTKVAGGGNVSADVFFGPDLQVSGAFVNAERAVGAGPLIPDNVIVGSTAAAGDQLTITLRETAGVATVVDFWVRKKPI